MRRPVAIAFAAIGVIVLIATTAIGSMVRSGLSTHVEPTWIEAAVAGAVRRWAVPSSLRNAKNPVPLSAAVLAGAIARHIVITGPEKREALDRARTLPVEEAPVAAVLKGATVHWAES